jgi:SAM-dependent methyltransferase
LTGGLVRATILGMTDSADIFSHADWYDLSINWQARLQRELPLLRETFGPPGSRGLLDAGCGTGRHVAALTRLGYTVTGLDQSPEMLDAARRRLRGENLDARLIERSFEQLRPSDGPFDGIFCLGNSLAAAGSAEKIEQTIAAWSSALAMEGRLFLQVLNFEKLRRESPPVRGPRVCRVDDRDYVSTRTYSFCHDRVEVTNVTHYNDGQWRHFVRTGFLHAVAPKQLATWFAGHGLTIIDKLADYHRAPFDPHVSDDLIIVAARE